MELRWTQEALDEYRDAAAYYEMRLLQEQIVTGRQTAGSCDMLPVDANRDHPP